MSSRGVLAFGLAALAALAGVSPVCGAQRLLERHRPLSVRWGEVDVAETTLVRIVRDGSETVYPNAVGLVFKMRLREEEMAGLLDGTMRARSQSATAGSLYVAARMGGGREAWEGFVRRLQETAGRLTPAAYEGFLGNVADALTGALEAEPGELTMVYCVVRPGTQELGGDISRTVVKTEKGLSRSTGSSTFGKGGPACEPLHEAFVGRATTDVLSTGFAIDESLEESLDLAVELSMDQSPVPLPEGASTSRKDAPEGATSLSSVSNREGVAHGELLRREPGSSYVLTVEMRDAKLPRDLPRGRSVLLRWDLARRDLRLGAPPRSLSEERQSLFMGIICTTEACAPDIGAFRDAAVEKLQPSEGLLSLAGVRAAMDLASLPADAFVVVCTPGPDREITATYCLSNVCARVLNPEPVCGDIAAAVPE